MVEHPITPGELVRRWANAHATALCVLAPLAIGRVVLIFSIEPGPGIYLLLFAFHLIVANLALAWILLAPYSTLSRLLSASIGLGASLVVTAGFSSVLSQSSGGSIIGALLVHAPSISLTGVALVSAWKGPWRSASAIPVVASILLALALTSIFVEPSSLPLLALRTLGAIGIHAVWMSGLYTVAGLVLSTRVANCSPRYPGADVL